MPSHTLLPDGTVSRSLRKGLQTQYIFLMATITARAEPRKGTVHLVWPLASAAALAAATSDASGGAWKSPRMPVVSTSARTTHPSGWWTHCSIRE